MQVSPLRYGRSLVGVDKSSLVFCGQSTPRFSARFFTKADDYKLRPNEELAERLVAKLVQPNFEQNVRELSIGCWQLPWMIRFTALFGQFHPSAYARSIFHVVNQELKNLNQEKLSKRLFVRLQINRKRYPAKIGGENYGSQKTITSYKYHSEAKDSDQHHHKKVWILYDESLVSLSTLNLPIRKWFQPFLITIGFVPEPIQPITSM